MASEDENFLYCQPTALHPKISSPHKPPPSLIRNSANPLTKILNPLHKKTRPTNTRCGPYTKHLSLAFGPNVFYTVKSAMSCP
ncbi:hypothetical protein BGS_1388 [Beggiatoa sp. SS]|nr:hypothetical protein BGS_1388 [Beggiatoa sp. SS]